MKFTPILHIILLFCFSPLKAQPGDTLRKIDELFGRWHNATPGVSIAISQNDKIIYKKAFGLADLEHLTPNTTETIFECGSVSKQFTAMSILLLAQEGKLHLQDDVHKFVPELPDYGKPIRIQHLLNHTSGLKDWGTIGALGGWPRTTRVYTQDLALQIICKQKSLNFPSGNEYSYSNTNYSLLVTIVERISGMPLEAFTRIRLFEPLDMKNTFWRSNFRQIIPGRAVAYSSTDDGYEQLMPFENIYGHGGLLTTTTDLLKWNKLLAKHSIGGDDVFRERIRKGKLNNGMEISYASGLFIAKVNGFDEIGHSGATAGYRGWLAYYPQKKLSVAILSNDGSFSPTGVGAQIAQLFLGKPIQARQPLQVNVAAESLKRFQGTYRSIRHFDAITFEYANGQIRSTNHNTEKDKDFIVIHPDTLYLDGQRWIYISPNRMMALDGTDTLTYARVFPPDSQAPRLKSLEGIYVSEEAAAEFQIDVIGNQLQVRQKPSKPFPLKPSFRDGFYSDNGQLFEFIRNTKGIVTSLLVSQSRAEKVPFTKISKAK